MLTKRSFFALAAVLLMAEGRADIPPEIVAGIRYLSEQQSYSWEVINADPGPIAQDVKTRRGTFTTVQRNASPHVRASMDRKGNIFLRRDWDDGLQLDSLITAAGAVVTKTPEGWLSAQEILTLQAEERLQENTATPRYTWLRRADRPDPRRPDVELAPLAMGSFNYEGSVDTFVTRFFLRNSVVVTPSDPEDAEPLTAVTITFHLRGGVIRDYEMQVEGSRMTRAGRVKVSEHRIVVITYLPVSKLDAPEEAWEKARLPQPAEPAKESPAP